MFRFEEKIPMLNESVRHLTLLFPLEDCDKMLQFQEKILLMQRVIAWKVSEVSFHAEDI